VPAIPPAGFEEDAPTPPSTSGSFPTRGLDALDNDGVVGMVLAERFRVEQLISRGAVGGVYQGRELATNRKVALKVLPTPQDEDHPISDNLVQRFLREGEALARLQSSVTVRVLGHGRDPRCTWVAMEFIEGRTLAKRLRERPLSPTEALYILDQLCDALDEAHEAGIVHRDIKPTNIFVLGGEDGRPLVKLVDFGIAKDIEDSSGLTRLGTLVGTPSYMSPEQVGGGRVDGRTDIYSVGILLYRCLMGRTPFADLTGSAVLIAHLRNQPPGFDDVRPGHGYPPHLEWTVRCCLEKDPASRFADIPELQKALDLCRRALLNSQPVPMPDALVDGRIPRPAGVAARRPALLPVHEEETMELPPAPAARRRARIVLSVVLAFAMVLLLLMGLSR
jgi:serine/threonine protein kinase